MPRVSSRILFHFEFLIHPIVWTTLAPQYFRVYKDCMDKVITAMEANLEILASEGGDFYQPTGRMRKSRTLTRADVIKTFETAFEQIGGVSRLAVWADTNPSEFFKLYGRLLPTSSTSELDGSNEMLIKHALPPPRNLAPPEVPDGKKDN